MMDLLHIKELRRGADGRNPKAENAANYDESKANPYPGLPDPLAMKNGEKVTTADMWVKKRRPEIVEDFDRETYGRVPQGDSQCDLGSNREGGSRNPNNRAPGGCCVPASASSDS